MASGVAAAVRATPAPRARRARDTLGRRASVPPGDVTSGERMRNVFGRTRAPRVAASAREGDASAPRPRRGRARRVPVPPPGAFREDERGSGAATTTAEPDPKSPRVPSNASETNIPSAEAAEAAGASGGWWAWTKRWALGDSDEDSDEDELSSSGGHDTPAAGQDDAAAPRGDAEASFLNRVPLPPWLKDQAAARVFSDDPAEALTSLTETLTETLTEEEKKSEEAVENRTARTAVGVGSITVTRDADGSGSVFARDSDHPERNMEAFAEALDDGGIVGDATVNRSGALAASVTKAAVDKLEDALAAVEARERARALANEEKRKKNKTNAAAASDEKAADSADAARDRLTAADADEAASELKMALEVARRRAAEAREASVALGEAARDVARAREAMKASSSSGSAADVSFEETDTQRKRRLRGALGAAGDRLLAASAASRAAAAAASASLRKVAFFDDDVLGAVSFGPNETAGAAVKSSATKTSGVNNESRNRAKALRDAPKDAPKDDTIRFANDPNVKDDEFRTDAFSKKVLKGSFEALELSGAVSRVAEWSVSRVFNTERKERTSAKASALSDAVAPALARVVAQSLEPSSPADLRHARVACGLAAWIYYLPTAHKSLAKFGLRMVASSLDAEEEARGAPAEAAAEAASRRGGDLSVARNETDVRFDDSDSDGVGSTDRGTRGREKTAKADAMARRAIDAADAAIEELARVAANPGSLADSVEAAREAARLAEAVSERLDALREEADEDDEREARRTRAKDDVAAPSPTTDSPRETHRSTAAFASNAVASRRLPGRDFPAETSKRLPSKRLPVAYAVAADDEKGTLWISIEGSTSLASWQTNLTFQPVSFEDPALDVRVHRGAYEAARDIYDAVEGVVRAHVDVHGKNARVHITGHSIGGSLAMVLALMLILRGAADKKHVADVWTFGAPYVLCGGDALLRRLSLPRSFIKSVAMGKDIVPRSFSCYYPAWARRALEMAPGSLKVDVLAQKSFLEEEMFYSPVGDMFLLQAMHGSAHPLLPPGPGLYQLAGDDLFDEVAAKVAENGETFDERFVDTIETSQTSMENHWLDRRAGAGWGEWFGDDREDETSAASFKAQKKNEKKASTHTSRSSVRRSNLNRLACLTQHDAALTASLILGSVDSNDSNENLSALLRERGRDAARRVVLNTPHPLTVLSDPKAYGNAGSISRHHNPFNYLRALGKTRRVWENGSQPRRNDVADALGSRDEDE